MQRAHSPSISPARKRQRLSSPTYEGQFDELTQEDLAAFDEIEARFSQGQLFPSTRKAGFRQHRPLASPEPQSPSAQGEPTSSFTIPTTNNAMLPDDSDNPFIAGFSSASKIAEPQMFLFTTAAGLRSAKDIDRPPSPEVPPVDHNYDDWFKPAPVDVSADFGVISFTTASVIKGVGEAPFILPSEASLAKAKARMAAWEMEDSILEGKQDVPAVPGSPLKHIQNAGFKRASHLKDKRPALTILPNALNAPDTPLSAVSMSTAPKMKMPPLPRHSAFKSPLQTTKMSTASNLPVSPLNAVIATSSTSGSRHPLSSIPVTAARLMQNTTHLDSNFSTPLRSNHSSRNRPAKFLTPFKLNMRPGEPGRLALPQSGNPSSSMPVKDISPVVTHNPTACRTTIRKLFFSLTPPPGRKTLANSGLRPQQYDVEQYHSCGIDITMLNQITPDTALFYVFHTRNDLELDCPHNLGPPEALNELHRQGCILAAKPWVDNHWCLILWKLAAMVALDPQSEGIPEQKRWCWSEVIRQLLYRYERELNSGIRPPFQKIANQDIPASHPLVVCVSNIFWSPGVTEDGVPIDPHPELEVTDGWYRLRAQIDLPIAKAIRKGVIKVGRKIAMAGARLSTEKKEPSEILDAYNSTKLILSANSSYPAAWDTKLGFTRGPCISTLHKLDPDGGLITAIDLVIIKAHPVAFLEFVKTNTGRTERLGPRNEAEEQRVQEEWKKRRDLEASKLQEEYDKKFRRYEGYIERLEAKAGQLLQVAEGTCGPHDETESFFDKLEYPNSAAEVLSRVTPSQAALLARRTRQHVELERQTAAEEIERELQESCTPREVRAFRVLIVQDSRTLRKPANRTAQLTVWNIMSLTLDEGSKPGDFAVGQRYLVSNVVPTSSSAWMNREPGSEVYLSTRRDTRWIKIKTR